MSLAVRIVDYYYLRIRDEPSKAYELLAQLAREEINLVAFSAVPYGVHGVELTLFPDRAEAFLHFAKKAGWPLTPSQHACLIQGDDRLGALAEIQRELVNAGDERAELGDPAGRFRQAERGLHGFLPQRPL